MEEKGVVMVKAWTCRLFLAFEGFDLEHWIFMRMGRVVTYYAGSRTKVSKGRVDVGMKRRGELSFRRIV